nr:hypothetical protein Iba_chr15dCG6650 [Ipomoea batatas]
MQRFVACLYQLIYPATLNICFILVSLFHIPAQSSSEKESLEQPRWKKQCTLESN